MPRQGRSERKHGRGSKAFLDVEKIEHAQQKACSPRNGCSLAKHAALVMDAVRPCVKDTASCHAQPPITLQTKLQRQRMHKSRMKCTGWCQTTQSKTSQHAIGARMRKPSSGAHVAAPDNLHSSSNDAPESLPRPVPCDTWCALPGPPAANAALHRPPPLTHIAQWGLIQWGVCPTTRATSGPHAELFHTAISTHPASANKQ
jgi:hypothetical protein